jgi:gliding motility-associated-like protein
VWVVNQASLFVPNGFTPNGDGLNDYLKMLSVGYAKINYFRVFNRWGEKVFETNEIGKGWDGRYKNQMADVGTYFWTLSVNNRFGKEEMIKGDVTLIR